MTATAGAPITITPDRQTNVPLLPNQSSLVLDNLSTFALQVTVGASVRWQAPLVEDSYDLGANASQVSVLPFLMPGDTATSGQITPTYYDTAPPARAWPVALSGPAEVAAATAAAILQTGVPSVFQSTILEALATLTPGAVSGIYDVHSYASIEFALQDPSGIGNPVCVSLSWRDGTGTLYDTTYISTMGNAHTVALPVLASSMYVTNLSPGRSARYSMIGTNRPVPAARSLNGSAPGHPFAATGVQFTAATEFKIPSADAVLLSDTAYNGLLQLHAFATAVGLLKMRWLRPDGTVDIQTVLNVNAANTELFATFPHAALARCEWWYRPTATAAGQSVFLDVYQVNP